MANPASYNFGQPDEIDAFAASIPSAERYTQAAKDTATSSIDRLRREALGGAIG